MVDSIAIQELGTILPSDVVAHAESRAWIRISLQRQDIALFKHPDGGLVQVIVPLDRSVDGYDRRISEAITRFAEEEKRPSIEIVNDLLARSADVLRFRIEIPGMDSGMIPFEDGARLFAGMRQSILSAVRGAMKPQRSYARLGGGSAEEFLKLCRMGQTERGSYIATIACPIGLLPERQSEGLPFTRQATGLLLNTMSTVATALDENRDNSLLAIQTENVVVSSNLCEAIAAMQPRDEGASLQIRCSWAPSIPVTQPMPDQIVFRSTTRDRLLVVAKQLKAIEQPETLTEYFASVEKLHGEPDVAQRKLGEIWVKVNDLGKTKTARLEVSPEDYAKALNAHRDGKGVSFFGRMVRGPKSRRIEQYKDFEILPNLPEL